DAEPVEREAAALRKKLFGQDNTRAATDVYNLARVLQGQGKLTEAETAFRESVALYKQAHTSGYWPAAVCSSLADLARSQGKLEEAEQWYQDALGFQKSSIPSKASNDLTTDIAVSLFGILQQQGKQAELDVLMKSANDGALSESARLTALAEASSSDGNWTDA